MSGKALVGWAAAIAVVVAVIKIASAKKTCLCVGSVCVCGSK